MRRVIVHCPFKAFTFCFNSHTLFPSHKHTPHTYMHTHTHTHHSLIHIHIHTLSHTHTHMHSHAHKLQGSRDAFLKYSDPKQVIFDSYPEQGVVYNVIAVDMNRRTRTAYVPTVTYACNFDSNISSCSLHPSIKATDATIGALVGLSGLFLCFLGHTFFHVGKCDYAFKLTVTV